MTDPSDEDIPPEHQINTRIELSPAAWREVLRIGWVERGRRVPIE